MTYLPMLYLSTIIDLSNNEIIAYRIVINTLEDACRGRENYASYYTMTKELSIHPINFKKKQKKKALPQACLGKATALIMPSLNPSIPR